MDFGEDKQGRIWNRGVKVPTVLKRGAPQVLQREAEMNRTISRFSMLMGVVSWLVIGAAAAQDKKPNVVLILADNVGYGDLGSYGGGELRGAPTPRLDQLANEGLRLTQYLVEPACTPSRVRGKSTHTTNVSSNASVTTALVMPIQCECANAMASGTSCALPSTSR